MPSDYRKAQIRARAAAGRQSSAALRAIRQDLDNWAGELTEAINSLPKDIHDRARRLKALEETRRVIVRSARQLEKTLAVTINQGREAGFREVQAIWQSAALEIAQTEGVPAALLGEVMSPNLTLMGAYESLGGASGTWRTLLPRYVQTAAQDVDRIIRTALERNLDPKDIAKSLRPYIRGADDFLAAAKAAGVDPAKLKDFRNLGDPALKRAARKLKHNTERIAFSEIHNARAEAEVQHFATDPLVYAVKWTLSRNRGKTRVPDQCDALADNAWYSHLGLGRGEFPLDQVPFPPHPWDRCERIPLVRSIDEIELDKPTGPRSLQVSQANIGRGLSAAQQDRLRRQVQQLFTQTEKSQTRQGLLSLMGNPKAGTLAPSPFDVLGAESMAREFLDSLEATAAVMNQVKPLPPPPPPPPKPPAPPVPPAGGKPQYRIREDVWKKNVQEKFLAKTWGSKKAFQEGYRATVTDHLGNPSSKAKYYTFSQGKSYNLGYRAYFSPYDGEIKYAVETWKGIEVIRDALKISIKKKKGRLDLEDILEARGTSRDALLGLHQNRIHLTRESLGHWEKKAADEIASYGKATHYTLQQIQEKKESLAALEKMTQDEIVDAFVAKYLNDFRTMVHEHLHSISPKGFGEYGEGYHNPGRWFEEAIVEHRSRRYTTEWLMDKDLFDTYYGKVYTPKNGSYKRETEAMQWFSKNLGEDAVQDLWDTASKRYERANELLFNYFVDNLESIGLKHEMEVRVLEFLRERKAAGDLWRKALADSGAHRDMDFLTILENTTGLNLRNFLKE